MPWCHPPAWLHFLPYGAAAATFLILLNLARLKAPPGPSSPAGS
ncbi:hypothetical protein BH09VER1_BH09VER1_44770 [soil metagenome]